MPSPKVPDEYIMGYLDKLDGRSAIAQELRARYAEVCADRGGADTLSYLERSLVERAIWAEYWITTQERHLAEGKPFDVGRYTQAVNAYAGLAAKIGLPRVPRNVTGLQEYLQGTRRADA
ncbi:MAG: hypothetical protein RSE12_14515 [Fuscovulum sp.]|nr:MAG: hypothetical protein RSE12_14515 [Fuscovulum sp.]